MLSTEVMTFRMPFVARQLDSTPRILIVRLSAHGDVIHTLPLLSALKKRYPQAYVGWLAEESAAPLLINHPLIDRLHLSPRKRWLKLAKNPLNWPKALTELRALIQELRHEKYEISLDVQGLLKSAIWPFLAKIPHRYGFLKTREFGDLFYTQPLPYHDLKNPNLPVVERFLDFARALGCQVQTPEFVIPPSSETSRQKVANLLSTSAPDLPLVVVAPFTRWPSKHWLPEAWTQLLTELLRLPVRVVILGSPQDVSAAQAILDQIPNEPKTGQLLNWVGQTDWPDLYVLFQQTRLMIGLDSGPLHVANAVGIPAIIGLYGPTSSGRTGPIGPQHVTLSTALQCQPCYAHECPIKTHDCMRQLTPIAVMAIVRQQLGLPAGSESGCPV